MACASSLVSGLGVSLQVVTDAAGYERAQQQNDADVAASEVPKSDSDLASSHESHVLIMRHPVVTD